MSKKKSGQNETQLRYACHLIKGAHGEDAFTVVEDALRIMDFGGISIKELLEWFDATGGEE